MKVRLSTLRSLIVAFIWISLLPSIIGHDLRAGQALNSNSPAVAEFSSGIKAYKAGQVADAIQHFERAAALDPGLLDAHLYLAELYSENPAPGAPIFPDEAIPATDLAIAHYKVVLRTDPNNAAAIRGLAWVYLQKANYDESRTWYQREIDVNPEDAEAYYVIGVIDWTQSFQKRMALKARSGIDPDRCIHPVSLREQLCTYMRPLIAHGFRMFNKAIEIRRDYADAMAYMSLMWLEQADCEITSAARARDIREADKWARRALQTRKRTPETPTLKHLPPPAPPPKLRTARVP